MWRSFSVLLLFPFFTTGIGVNNSPYLSMAAGDAQQSSGNDSLAIRQLEEQWVNADRLPQTLRIQFFESVLDPDGLHILHDGKSYFNREILDYYRSHPEAPRPEDAPHSRIAGMEVRMYGDIAIVNGTTQIPDAKGATHLNRFTDVFQKRNGKWLAINEQETDVKGTELGAQE